MKTIVLSLLIAISMASNVRAAPCGGDIVSRDELRQLIRAAGEERPISITFLTEASGVQLSQPERTLFPHEMTIILQYQFRYPVVAEDRLEVGLEFKGVPERVIIPLAAITAVYDPVGRKC
jgi:hypothetical protein